MKGAWELGIYIWSKLTGDTRICVASTAGGAFAGGVAGLAVSSLTATASASSRATGAGIAVALGAGESYRY
jgi:tRNA A37 threonylcarbamoyladenosine modification protein TsaB